MNLCKTKRNSAEFEECAIRICGIEKILKKNNALLQEWVYAHIGSVEY